MPGPPYGIIAGLLKTGQVVPFLGAGVNRAEQQEGDGTNHATDASLPTGSELSLALADESDFPEEETNRTDLSKVASYFVEQAGRQVLRERLHKVFDRDFTPCDIHTYLAEIASPMLIVTTNYDDLTERAFAQAGRPFDLVVHPTDRRDLDASVLWWKAGVAEPVPVPPNELLIDLKATTVIYKMHGTVDRRSKWDSYVITEEDYVDFLSRMTGNTAVPAIFMRHFRSRHFLFLGYGLRDWNLRVVLRNMKTKLPGTAGAEQGEDDDAVRSWAIQFRPSALEKELWNARNIKIYDLSIGEFVKQLRERQS
jgi:hypothetical protein